MKQIFTILVFALFFSCSGKKQTDTKAAFSYMTPTHEILESGKATYDKYCTICHTEGVGGAAKLDNIERWTNNRKKDINLLVQHVHDGYTGEFGTMTPKGTCIECSKEDLRNAIFFIMSEAGVLE